MSDSRKSLRNRLVVAYLCDQMTIVDLYLVLKFFDCIEKISPQNTLIIELEDKVIAYQRSIGYERKVDGLHKSYIKCLHLTEMIPYNEQAELLRVWDNQDRCHGSRG